jgi:hypothetical protein
MKAYRRERIPSTLVWLVSIPYSPWKHSEWAGVYRTGGDIPENNTQSGQGQLYETGVDPDLGFIIFKFFTVGTFRIFGGNIHKLPYKPFHIAALTKAI